MNTCTKVKINPSRVVRVLRQSRLYAIDRCGRFCKESDAFDWIGLDRSERRYLLRFFRLAPTDSTVDEGLRLKSWGMSLTA